MSENMIERVARAIEALMPNKSASEARIYARAAVAAMRDPTEAMRTAGNAESDWGTELEVWRAMIDAALRQHPHPPDCQKRLGLVQDCGSKPLP